MPSAKIISSKTNSISLDGTPYKDLANKIPAVVNKVLIFELTGANCSIANAIRRTLKSEMAVKHLTVSLTDIKTNGPIHHWRSNSQENRDDPDLTIDR
ncbi:hypothetical protein PC129_g14723 [Phytophthora cactorum]|uniref:Uncharacterized protein n=1 Tax=Phytophthora cactorum TaxID=29920 RepID=A0A329RR67_9STRA|nr:hypothetical protein Pcac1_g11761 [Phytophthora cactorum]KAG2809593.1 hypothetical protein PC112_g16440 [Phytophthora cactorum]KAG2811158.1 hypothetical protein PC111_g15352 [Phytophthora cactorum]KAG2850768.1 hypothetical protein PC113_g16499 [Phytophthora cactorum]KAG2889213.1 hypothetical protein PC114_g18062 [Phytophthora cactorum]